MVSEEGGSQDQAKSLNVLTQCNNTFVWFPAVSFPFNNTITIRDCSVMTLK